MTAPSSPAVTANDWRAATNAAVVTESTGLGLLAVSGADAAAFLHGQLSNDVKGLAPGAGRWATYNSPKGRVLASLFVWRAPDGPGDRYLALVGEDIAASMRSRLAMFVLRSKVVVADETAATVRFGISGPLAEAAVAALGAVPERGSAVAVDGGTAVRLPDGRYAVVATASAAARVRTLLQQHARGVGRDVWEWLAICAGVSMVTAATQDLFVAQMANWDALGGLDFHKGCYPGQEIVARTHHLGRLKERMFAYRTPGAPPAPGARLFGAPFGDQPCGTVVNAAPDPEGGARFLAVVQIDAAQGPLAIDSPDGPTAVGVPLPYPLPAPSEPRGRVRL